MTRQFLSEVRDQLAERSTTTSLSELRQRGMERVRVIRSSQVLQLIEEAVDRALSEIGLDASGEEREEVLQKSQQIFQGMMQELQAARGSSDELAVEYRRRSQELESAVTQMQEELAKRETALQESQAKAAELDAELRVLHERQEKASPDALLEELKSLRHEISEKTMTPVEAVASDSLNAKLEGLSSQLGEELQRIGRKVGVASAEEADSDLSSLFKSDGPELESNLDNVQAKESKGADVADALARIKSLKNQT